MKFRTIWENVYSLKRQKPKGNVFFLVVLASTFLCFLALFYLKFPKVSHYEGVYHCDEVCKLETVFSFQDSKELQEHQKIMIQNQEVTLQKIEFKEIEYQGNQVFQVLQLEIPNLSKNENQTVEFQFLKEDISLWNMLYQAMKGGDENVK